MGGGDELSENERAEIAWMIQQYEKYKAHTDGYAAYDARELLRNRLTNGLVVLHEGRLYLNRCGELIVVELEQVVDVTEVKP